MTTKTQHMVGQPLPRLESRDKVTGISMFTGDVRLPNMVYMKTLGSPHAHAEILSIDVSKALKIPGVKGIVTGADLPKGVALNFGSRGHSFLAKDKVYFYGQVVAAVAAVDLHTAEEALKHIEVKYKPLPILMDPLEAMKPGSAIIQHKGEKSSEMDMHNADAAEKEDIGDSDIREAKELEDKTPAAAKLSPNVANHIVFKVGDVQKGFAESDIVVENTYTMSQVHQGYLEPQAATASWDAVNQQLSLWVSAQGQFYERQHAAEVLGLPIHKVKVTTLEVGGGFGAKFGLVGPLVGLVSMKVGLPVSYVYTRHEELQASNPAPGSVIKLKTGCKQDGTLMAIEARVVVDTGAYSGSPMSIICIMLGAPYKFPNVHIDGYEVLTNKQSVAAYRAPGGPNSASAIEQQIDIMAKETGINALDFRMHNASEEGFIRPDGTPQPKIGLKAVLEAVKKHSIWKQPLGPNQGRGLAIGGWGGGRGPSSAMMKLEGDGTFEVVVGTVDLSGTNTSFAQIAADTLGLPTSKIRVRRADTDTAPFGPAAGGSQVTYSTGPAIIEAANDVRRQMLKAAAQEFEVDEKEIVIDAVGLHNKVNHKSLSWPQFHEVTSGFIAKYAPIIGHGTVTRRKGAPGYAALVADVEVDPETGFVKILRLVAVQDVGKAINRLSVEGQIQGGTVQGVGIAMWEEIMYGPDGRVRNASLLDYRKATARDLPLIDVVIVEQPSEDGPFGAKIVGEPSIVPPAGALPNAIANAIGTRVFDLPVTPERVMRALGKVQQYDHVAPKEATAPTARNGKGQSSDDAGEKVKGKTEGSMKVFSKKNVETTR